MALSKSLDETFQSRASIRGNGILTKAEKKRRQNRINQHAYRKREAEKAAAVESRNHPITESALKPPIQVVLLPVKHRRLSYKEKTYSNVDRKRDEAPPVPAGFIDKISWNSTPDAFKRSLNFDFNVTGLEDALITQTTRQALLGEIEIVYERPYACGQGIIIPKQIYWEWAVQHPESISDDEIQSLQNVGGITGFNKPAYPVFRFPISVDHKIMIIQWNLYRAMKVNKDLLSLWLAPCPHSGTLPRIPDGTVAPCLQSTALQQILVHPNWIAVFPHPRVRDNLILRQRDICWDDMMTDLAGYLYPCHTQCVQDDHLHRIETDYDDPSDVANAGHGIIVWGEPWDISNWELTPSFVRKWKRILTGCQDMIIASNKWRALRDEPPILEILD